MHVYTSELFMDLAHLALNPLLGQHEMTTRKRKSPIWICFRLSHRPHYPSRQMLACVENLRKRLNTAVFCSNRFSSITVYSSTVIAWSSRKCFTSEYNMKSELNCFDLQVAGANLFSTRASHLQYNRPKIRTTTRLYTTPRQSQESGPASPHWHKLHNRT